MEQIVESIMFELLFIIMLTSMNIIVKVQKFETEYSKNEQSWVCYTLTILVFIFIGFTVFRAITLDLSSATGMYFSKLIILMTYEFLLNVGFLVAQMNYLEEN